MRRLVAVICALALSLQGQILVRRGALKAASGGASYTSQVCVGGSSGNQSPTPCTSALTLNTGDEVIVGGTQGFLNTITISTITCASGTATVTWSVQSGLTLWDSTNAQGMVGGVGNVTSGGTCTPQITWSTLPSNVGIIAAAFSGTANTVDGTPATHQNTGSSSANANASGSVTTASNNDLLAGILVDTSGAVGTVSAGTTSVTYAKILCDSTSAANLCIEWGTQTTAAAGTQANWTLSNSDRTVAGIVAIH